MAYPRQESKLWDFKDADTKEYTHCYHNYPAMMIPQVARRILSEFRPEGRCELLFDPYVGSGTSLVEASLCRMDSVGTDLNPLARFISKVKTTRYDAVEVEREFRNIQNASLSYSAEAVKDRDFERISNREFWYSHDVLLRLSFLSQLIAENSADNIDFFNLALSEVVREASYTRNGEFKRFRMDKNRIATYNPDVFRMFEEKVKRNITGLVDYRRAVADSDVKVYGFDSTLPIPEDAVAKESVDMVLTSPPYGDSRTTVAYGQFSRWANEWFSFEHARNLDTLLMGGRKNDSAPDTKSIDTVLQQIKDADLKRYGEVVSFLNDYKASITNVADTVRKGGVACYVVGNRNVKGVQIPLDYFTAEMFERCGFGHVTTVVRSIPNKRMPSKTSPTNVAGKKVDTMSSEYIVVMKKL